MPEFTCPFADRFHVSTASPTLSKATSTVHPSIGIGYRLRVWNDGRVALPPELSFKGWPPKPLRSSLDNGILGEHPSTSTLVETFGPDSEDSLPDRIGAWPAWLQDIRHRQGQTRCAVAAVLLREPWHEEKAIVNLLAGGECGPGWSFRGPLFGERESLPQQRRRVYERREQVFG